MKTKAKENLGARVRRVREARGLSRGGLAVIAEVSYGTIQLIEKTWTLRPGDETLTKIASALGVTTKFLREGGTFAGEVVAEAAEDLSCALPVSLLSQIEAAATEAGLSAEEWVAKAVAAFVAPK